VSDGPTIRPEWLQRLRAVFPNVRVHWNRKLNVWELQERSMQIPEESVQEKDWVHIRYWAKIRPGRMPEFFPLPESPELVIRLLRAIDMQRFERLGAEGFARLEAHQESSRNRWVRQQAAKWDEAGTEYRRDMAARILGVRGTFGPGGPSRTKRNWTGSENMRKHARELMQETSKTPDQSDPIKALKVMES